MSRVINFSPGPATLPSYVLERAKEDIWSYNGCGIGVMELSHRSPQFLEIIGKTEEILRRLLKIPVNYKVLFTTGGGSNQFSMIPMNLVEKGQEANYLLSGFWAERAATEAEKFSTVHIAGSSKDNGYKSLPSNYKLSKNPAYLHFTSNNTIYGTQSSSEPVVDVKVPLICDASSDILSKEIDINKYGLIYAANQKNAGTAGVTTVVIREDLLARSKDSLPVMMNYKTYSENNSLYNTPPTFSIYIAMRTLEWIELEGGVATISERAEQRATLLYDCIDRNDLYVGYADKNSRSKMNVTFHLKNDSLTAQLIEEAGKLGISGLAGYRTMGGLRVSLYNAVPVAWVKSLVEFLDQFASKHR
jgi:phosphoserine aminotransferase